MQYMLAVWQKHRTSIIPNGKSIAHLSYQPVEYSGYAGGGLIWDSLMNRALVYNISEEHLSW